MKSKYGHLSKSQLVKTFNGLTNSRERAMIKETAKRKGFYEESDFQKMVLHIHSFLKKS